MVVQKTLRSWFVWPCIARTSEEEEEERHSDDDDSRSRRSNEANNEANVVEAQGQPKSGNTWV